jgi:AraC family transcriptional regulator, exoenzyme S synthesis regulatory protein ExsA
MSRRSKSGGNGWPSYPMLNAFEVIRANPTAKRFEIGELLFAQFTCPALEEPVGIWTQTDHMVHVLTGKSTWKTASGTWSAEAGQTVFFKKGAYILPQHFEEDLCVFLFFIPDTFARQTVREVAADLPAISERLDSRERAIRVNNDVVFVRFFSCHGRLFLRG